MALRSQTTKLIRVVISFTEKDMAFLHDVNAHSKRGPRLATSTMALKSRTNNMAREGIKIHRERLNLPDIIITH